MSSNQPAKPTQPLAVVKPDRALTMKVLAERTANPITWLPREYQVHALGFYTRFSRLLFGDQVELYSRLAHWVDDGLSVEDMREAMRRVSTPEQVSLFKDSNAMMRALAGEVAALKRRSYERVDTERLKDDRTPEERERARKLLADLAARFSLPPE